jgi:hypothetical protein
MFLFVQQARSKYQQMFFFTLFLLVLAYDGESYREHRWMGNRSWHW